MTGIMASFLLLFGCSNAEKPLFEEVQLNENWTFQSENMTEELQAQVPGNYVNDMLRHALIEDPYLKDNVSKIETGREDVVYRCEFDKPAFDCNKQDLVFDGLDTYADVYVNGKWLGSTDNMHRQYRFQLLELKDENNLLEVKFSALLDVLDSLVENSSLVLPEEWAHMRKASFQFGWDWAPKTPSLGIWRDVRIEGYDNFRMISSWVEAVKIDEDYADMLLILKLDVHSECDMAIGFQSDNFSFEKTKRTIEKGEQVIHVPFRIENPQLWYPNGMGESHLYTARLEIESGNKRCSEDLSFGVRTIQLRREKDSIGESFEFVVNGIPVFAKGANYVPQDAFLCHSDHERLLQSCVDVNFNMIRVWGGGIYEDDRFYELCDSLGLMVWQDYMFACALYPGDDAFFESVEEEIKQQTDRLRGHASMALWCGNNEVSNAWFDWGWQSVFNWSEKDSAQIWNQNAYLFNEMIPAILKESGVETDYLPSSPVWGWGHEESFTEGDNHYWGVWWGEEPFESYREHTGRFMSEFGFQAWPTKKTLDIMHEGEALGIESDIMKAHQRHPFGDRLIREYMERYFGTNSDPEEFAQKSQELQAYGIGEAMRWFRAQPKCAGSLYWQLNDCWPSVSWSSLDYYGEWKALHYAAKDAYAPYMLYAVDVDGKLTGYLVADFPEACKADLNLTFHNGEGVVATVKRSVEISAWNHNEMFEIDLPGALMLKSDWKLIMTIESEDGLLADYVYYPVFPKFRQ